MHYLRSADDSRASPIGNQPRRRCVRIIPTILNLATILVGLYGGSLGGILATRKNSLASGLMGAGILLLVVNSILGLSFTASAWPPASRLAAVILLTWGIHRLWAGDEPVRDAEVRRIARQEESAVVDERL